MLFYVLVILLAFWALGFGVGVGGNLVHLFLAAAAVLLVVELAQRTKSRSGRAVL